MTEDIAYWVNKHLVDRSTEFDAATDRASGNGSFCLNCAVEESTLSDRFNGELLAHDEFVRDNLRADDMILISAGGNDIALRPGAGTIANMLALVRQTLTPNTRTRAHARNLHLFLPRSVTTVICFNLCLQSVSTSAYFNLNLFRARTIYHTCTHTLSII